MVKSKGDVLFNILVYVIIFTVGLICLNIEQHIAF